jgi:hypothetical protein
LLASLQPSLPKRQVKALELIDKGSEQNWSLAEVHKNLFMIYYDDLGKSEVDVVERHNTELLAKTLRSYVEYLVQITGAAFVVMDCHGGPDNMSFAACIIASRAILVSEPDRITLHGTLNFLRNLKRQIPDASLDIRLIFNKVVAAFSPMFLFRFYDQYLRAEFGGADLLGIFPLEIHLTKEFEKMPFLTTGYPYSQLAIKTRLALFEMFAGEPGITLPPRVASMTKSERWIAKYYMGRWPRILKSGLCAESDCDNRAFGVWCSSPYRGCCRSN